MKDKSWLLKAYEQEIERHKEDIKAIEEKTKVLKRMMYVDNEKLYRHMHKLRVDVNNNVIMVHVPSQWLIFEEQVAIIKKFAKDVYGECYKDETIVVNYNKMIG